jgi:hypothetical protein
LKRFVVEDNKLLIRGRINKKLITFVYEQSFQLLRFIGSVFRYSEIQIIREKRGKLHADDAALRKHRAAALYKRYEMLRRFILVKNDRLAAERADLCAAYVKRVAQSRKLFERNIAGAARKAVAETRAVEEKIKPVFVADAAKLCKFVF